MKNMSLTVEGHIAFLELNSPPVNTITPMFMDELEAAFTQIQQLPDIRSVILYSAVPKVFVAGADIKAFQNMDGEGTKEVSRRGHQVLDKIENMSIPVICVVEGVAFGGGLELALACDIRIMGEKAKVGLPETSLGIIPGYGGTQRLPLLIGEANAKKMMFTAQPVKAEEAYRLGLAQEICPMGQALDQAKKMAETICKNGPLAVAAAKCCIHEARKGDVSEGIQVELEQSGNLFETRDKWEGMTAFIEKRAPEFKKC